VIFHQGDLTLAQGVVNKIVEFAFYLSTKLSMKMSDVVSTYAQDYAQQSPLLSQFMHKFHQLLMPIYLGSKENSEPDAIKPILELKKNGKVIFGFGGRFVNEKGFDVLLQAIPLILEKIPNAHFAFAGETKMSYEQTYEKLAPQIQKLSEHISILGLLNGSALRWFYDSIDFIVIPSRSDCCPLVQMEACLDGRPSICSDIPGAGYIVKASGFGRIFQSENSKDLADKVLDAVESRSQIQENYPKLKELLDLERLKGKIRNALIG
jgi:glycosyltransferase involved in cell wall biosynthesis